VLNQLTGISKLPMAELDPRDVTRRMGGYYMTRPRNLVLRAEIRADFSLNKNARRNLPALPGLNFEKINFSAPGMGADQVCMNMRVYKGNSVKTNVLSANSEFVPEQALIRFDQENGRGSGKLVKIAPAESMSGIEITVSNRKPEAGSSTETLRVRLGSPRGGREKGEVHKEQLEKVRKEQDEKARKVQVEKELQAARDRQDARSSAPHQPLKAIGEKTKDRLERSLDSSFEKPISKKKKVQESSSSSEESSSDISSDDNGELVTKDIIRLQSLKVEVEVTRLMRLKGRVHGF